MIASTCPLQFLQRHFGRPGNGDVFVHPTTRLTAGQLRNIDETGEFVVNIVSEAQFEAMNISSGTYMARVNSIMPASIELTDRGGATGIWRAGRPGPFQTINLPRKTMAVMFCHRNGDRHLY